MPFHLWQPPCSELIELQGITRRILQINTEITRERNRLHAANRKGEMGKVIAWDIEVNIHHLERRIKRLETGALKKVALIPELQAQLDLITSTTGIANTSGLKILSELMVLPEDMKGPQWVAHAGLDPRPYESGSSTKKPRRITKAGNRYLREALYMPALVSIRHDPNVGAFYEKLINAGKKPMQAIVAVMRKLLLALWGMLHHNQVWNGKKFYQLPQP